MVVKMQSPGPYLRTPISEGLGENPHIGGPIDKTWRSAAVDTPTE